MEFRVADGGSVLAGLPHGAVDLAFLDAQRPKHSSWWPQPYEVPRRSGVLVADHALSHPEEIAPPHLLRRATHDQRRHGRAGRPTTLTLKGPVEEGREG